MAITLDGTTGVTAAEFDGALDASNLTGALPAIDGSALTGISAGIGEGQTPQPVSRSIDTSYQNTTGRPILVSVGSGSRDSDLLEVSSNNSTWVTAAYGDGGSRSTRTTVVPNNWYYRYGPTASTSAFWMEIR